MSLQSRQVERHLREAHEHLTDPHHRDRLILLFTQAADLIKTQRDDLVALHQQGSDHV